MDYAVSLSRKQEKATNNKESLKSCSRWVFRKNQNNFSAALNMNGISLVNILFCLIFDTVTIGNVFSSPVHCIIRLLLSIDV